MTREREFLVLEEQPLAPGHLALGRLENPGQNRRDAIERLVVIADARPLNLEPVDSGDELGDRTDALAHVVEPAPADDAERDRRQPAEIVDAGAYGVRHDRLVRS